MEKKPIIKLDHVSYFYTGENQESGAGVEDINLEKAGEDHCAVGTQTLLSAGIGGFLCLYETGTDREEIYGGRIPAVDRGREKPDGAEKPVAG